MLLEYRHIYVGFPDALLNKFFLNIWALLNRLMSHGQGKQDDTRGTERGKTGREKVVASRAGGARRVPPRAHN
jgi:hypothetical protein